MRTLVVTAADEAFAPLVRGLVESLHQWDPAPFTDLGFLDLGLAPESRAWIARRVAHVVEPGWDLDVDAALRAEKPALRAHTARPFLPKYFPGYDAYLWIDADAWVQEKFAVEWCFAVAAGGPLAAAPHVDRAYRQTPAALRWRMDRQQAYYGEEARERVLWETSFNSGVFALRGDAPHWACWARWFAEGLARTEGKLLCDQTALNQAILEESLPVSPLPALCNWLCHLALPGLDLAQRRFCEPFPPRQPIGILHLTADTKDLTVKLPRADGRIHPSSLRFGEAFPRGR